MSLANTFMQSRDRSGEPMIIELQVKIRQSITNPSFHCLSSSSFQPVFVHVASVRACLCVYLLADQRSIEPTLHRSVYQEFNRHQIADDMSHGNVAFVHRLSPVRSAKAIKRNGCNGER